MPAVSKAFWMMSVWVVPVTSRPVNSVSSNISCSCSNSMASCIIPFTTINNITTVHHHLH